jgi:hypothetical protein
MTEQIRERDSIFTYKPIDLANLAHIQQEVLLAIDSAKYTSNTLHDVYLPEFFDNCTYLKQEINKIIPWNLLRQIHVISHKPGASYSRHNLSAHIDDLNSPRGLLNGIAFNIPIYNCKDTTCDFYEALSPPTLMTPEFLAAKGVLFDKPFWAFTNIKNINSMKGNTACIFNTQVPHMPVNTTKEPRIVVSLRYPHEINITEYFKDQ